MRAVEQAKPLGAAVKGYLEAAAVLTGLLTLPGVQVTQQPVILSEVQLLRLTVVDFEAVNTSMLRNLNVGAPQLLRACIPSRMFRLHLGKLLS